MALEGKKILVTGGLGYIGSHTAVVLLEAGAKVVLIDNLSNTYLNVLEHVKRLAGDKASQVSFVKCDIRDAEGLRTILQNDKFDATIHFAGFKAVGESVEQPLLYYDNNFAGTVVLLKELAAAGCQNVVFSSSCTVYGIPEKVPLTETSPLQAVSPYGRTKLFQEIMFRDICKADNKWRVMLLRYFNPVGAHPSGELGEHPVGVPNNLMPYVQQVALGQREFLRIFGNDYDTPDGTAVRDYVHVVDIALGHVAAVKKLLETHNYGCHAINLGTGKGTSVLEMVHAFEQASKRKVPYKLVERRPGDSTEVWASTEVAERELGWTAKFDILDMCEHQWNWASKYPDGYHYKKVQEDGEQP